jgi:hypothetical protein
MFRKDTTLKGPSEGTSLQKGRRPHSQLRVPTCGGMSTADARGAFKKKTAGFFFGGGGGGGCPAALVLFSFVGPLRHPITPPIFCYLHSTLELIVLIANRRAEQRPGSKCLRTSTGSRLSGAFCTDSICGQRPCCPARSRS